MSLIQLWGAPERSTSSLNSREERELYDLLKQKYDSRSEAPSRTEEPSFDKRSTGDFSQKFP